MLALELGTVDGLWISPNSFLRRKVRLVTVGAGDFLDIDHYTKNMHKGLKCEDAEYANEQIMGLSLKVLNFGKKYV